MQELTIKKIEAWACEVPLGGELDFGRFRIDSRKHTVVRVTTDDGLVSEIIGQSRGAPIDVAILDVVGPLCLGRSAAQLTALRSHVYRSLAAMELDGTIGRAWSLIELCLNDLSARAAGQPLWQWLGGEGRNLDVLLVEGYALVGEDDNTFARRLAARAEEGYRLIKMEVAHYEPRNLVRRLECCARELPLDVKLVLDYAWLWDSMRDKAELLRKLETFNVAWIEDVFPRTEIDLYRELRSATKLQVGCGDETTRVQDALDLVEREAIDVIRLDATTMGGIHECRRAFSLASTRGVQVSFHEHPEIHQHVILGLNCTDHVEVFPEDRPFDKVCDLWHSDLFNRIYDGRISPPADPGTGIRLKEENVRRYATRFGAIEENTG